VSAAEYRGPARTEARTSAAAKGRRAGRRAAGVARGEGSMAHRRRNDIVSGEESGRMMKLMDTGLVVSFILMCGVVSCSEEKNPAQQYGNTMTQSYKNTKKFDKDLNVQQIQKSILEFNAANGRYPADLSELSSFSGLTLKSDNYEYDPANGTLREKK
jgi:hypothetical protein